ncbi:CidA/LrgA family protein [Zhouia sp. PK063]|uniref:CidA/LrgA family protein n=1 Tax=Zhouia sp. PK063 TaxID=3373602 RepID=UPI00378A7B24
MIRELSIIFGCLCIGKCLVALTGLPLPSSIVGMFFLLLLLITGTIKEKDVAHAGNFFTTNIAFFFVPAGVAIMAYIEVLQQYFWVVLVATVVSILTVLFMTGWTHQLLRKKRR